MKEHGVDRQVLSLTTPGTHVEEPATAVKLARLVNDGFAAIARDSKRFVGIATLPLSDPAASAKELDRACRLLGFCGAMVFSNINGVALSDPRFMPVWEVANDLGAVIHIHPSYDAGDFGAQGPAPRERKPAMAGAGAGGGSRGDMDDEIPF